jgi:hypothetical protein
MTYYGLHISEYRACQDCTLCLCTESAGVPAGAAAPVTGAAADEYNLNVVDCNTSVTGTVALRHAGLPSQSVGVWGYPAPSGRRVRDEDLGLRT